MPKTTTEATYEPLKKGIDPRTVGDGDEGAVRWLKLEPNTHTDVTALVNVDDIIATEQCAIWLGEDERAMGLKSPVWVYTGAGDPSHDLGVERSYKAFLPVLHDGEVKVWSMGKSAHRQILDAADAAGDLAGMNLRIKRTGSGKSTRWSVTPRGTRTKIDHIEEVDVPSMLGPLTVAGVQELIAERLKKPSYLDVVHAYRGSTTFRGAKPARTTEDDETVETVKLI